MNPCPDVDELESLSRRTLDVARRQELRDHASHCDRCAALIEDVSANVEEEAFIRRMKPDGAGAPGTIGRFRILHELGRGGMGVVYLAEQTSPKRRVALKVIRPGGVSETTLRRFRQEADVLARLKHPGIAHIYEAGLEETDGPGGRELRPYFAMELVDGVSIDDYVERHALEPRARIELLARVCDAAHHAHVQGVIHRDLKPGNVLVQKPAGEEPGGVADPGQPKILDFGVARLTETDPVEATMGTQQGQLVGTLAFMSPEQVKANEVVDARSDVYSLGVMGYVILAGRLPFEAASRSAPELIRRIQDEDPSLLGDLDRRFRGDIETILAKALEKDRERRYVSAAGLAGDLRRYLRDEPVLARKPSPVYQLRKFAGRNPGLANAVVALIAVLAGAAVLGSSLAYRAERAEKLARTRLAELSAEAAKLKGVNEFVLEMLASPNAYTEGGRAGTTVSEVLDAAAGQLAGGRFDAAPAIEAEVRSTLANSYWTLGRYADAEVQLLAALALQESLGVEGAFSTLNDLGILMGDRSRYAEAEAFLRRQLAFARDRMSPANPERDAAMALGQSNLGGVLRDLGRYDEAESQIREVMGRGRKAGTIDPEATLALRHNLAQIERLRGNWEAAAALYRECLDGYRSWNAEYPAVTKVMNGLATTLTRLGSIEAADSLAREALELNRRFFPEEHPDIALSLAVLSRIRKASGDLDEAERLGRRALEMNVRLLGRMSRRSIESRQDLGVLLAARGRASEGEDLLSGAASDAESLLGADHPDLATVLIDLANVRKQLGRREEARALAVCALEIRRKGLGQDSPLTREAERWVETPQR